MLRGKKYYLIVLFIQKPAMHISAVRVDYS
jgi:hypothetical protein